MSEAELLTPDSLDEALAVLADAAAHGAPLTLLAGGTDLLVKWSSGQPRPARVLSLHRLAELRTIALEDGAVRVGACCTHAQLSRSDEVRRACPALCEAAATVGAAQVQEQGTLGGNLVNASPAADLPPPLLAARAGVELVSREGRRRLPLDRFFVGYRKIDLRPDELLAAVHIPVLPERAFERFRKIGTRRAQAIAKVCGACRIERDEAGLVTSAGFAFGSVAPITVRLAGLEAWLGGRKLDEQTAEQAERLAIQSVQPIDDVRSTADYRRLMVGRLVREWLAPA
jgi:CO/xanthine dehydrogenase FAD-binding subunit